MTERDTQEFRTLIETYIQAIDTLPPLQAALGQMQQDLELLQTRIRELERQESHARHRACQLEQAIWKARGIV